MKIYVMIVDTSKNGISQNGMIEESVSKGFEIANALGHFGVNINTIEWIYEHSKNNFRTKTGEIKDTTKIVNIVVIP
jgi:hypothetical protein